MKSGLGAVGVGGESAEHKEFIFVRRKWCEPWVDFVTGAFPFRPPFIDVDAQSVINETKPADRSRRRKTIRSQSRDHGVQQRQGQRRSGSAQERPPGKVLLRDDHDWSFGLAGICLI